MESVAERVANEQGAPKEKRNKTFELTMVVAFVTLEIHTKVVSESTMETLMDEDDLRMVAKCITEYSVTEVREK